MMNPWKRFRIVTLLVLLLAFGCEKNAKEVGERSSLPAPSHTARVEHEDRALEIAGTVRAADVAQLASRFAGFVNRVNVQAGQHVKKGDLLVLMDDRNLRAQRSKIAAATEEAQRGVQAADAQLRLAKVTFTRMEMLSEKKAVSQQEYDEAKSRKESATAAYEAALQRVAQAQSDMRDVQASSDYLRITAPFAGIVTSVPVDAGTFVNPGQTIVTMENRSNYEVIFSVEEELLNSVQKGRSLVVAVPAISADALSAKVEEVNAAADINTRTFQVKAVLQIHPQLRSGLSARVFFATATEGSLWIPEKFLSRNDDIETVLVKQKKEWRRILVKSGNHKDGKVEILSGLNDAEEVGI
jgi:RND family efflux transporter MFP subunit